MDKPSNRIIIISLLIAIVLCVAARITELNIEKHLRDELGESLSAVLDTTRQAIESWALEEQRDAMIWGNRGRIKEEAGNLLDLPRDRQALLDSPSQAELRTRFELIMEALGYQGYFFIAPDNISVASSRDENVGTRNLLAGQGDFLNRIWAGKTALSMPLASDVQLVDERGVLVDEAPTMFAGAPVFDENRKVIAAFAFRVDPSLSFTSILQQGRIGDSGETYAFNSEGLMISLSRYDDQLRDIGLLEESQQGIMNVRLLDPGLNLLNGERSNTPIVEQPLTYSVNQALEGRAGVNVDGYRNYRGVPVVGAWVWDSSLDIGITTEVDIDEAYESLFYIRRTVIVLTAVSILLLAALTVVFIIDRKRIAKSEKERAVLQKQLFHSQKMEAVNLLVGGVAHNFNNMLASVVGYTELATMEAASLNNDELISHLDEVMIGSNRAIALIKKMSAFIGKKSLGLSPKLLHEFLIESIDMLNSVTPPGIDIRKQIEETEAVVMIDTVELYIALINLCINASDALNGQGRIDIRLYREIVENKECHSCFEKISGEYAVLAIADRGHGIEESNLSRVFDPFYTTKDLSEGAGMGLPMAHGIMHEHNGHVQIQSELNHGTTVRLYFPIG
ncbi:MAG: signal transduction histidine kinase [Candidatus Pelagisphaera sp.]|jgi:signal transduction histidine kinase